MIVFPKEILTLINSAQQDERKNKRVMKLLPFQVQRLGNLMMQSWDSDR